MNLIGLLPTDGLDSFLRCGPSQSMAVSDLGQFGVQADSVAVYCQHPLAAIRSFFAVDGLVRRCLLLSASLRPEAARALLEEAEIGHCLTDVEHLPFDSARIGLEELTEAASLPARETHTQWLIPTSGTTGTPKIVRHSLDSLIRTVKSGDAIGRQTVWGLLYEPTRFAGLQVVLQALAAGSDLVCTDPAASLVEKVDSFVHHRCNALSATPSMWRRILMCPNGVDLTLRQITLGGEIADQSILDALAVTFPNARIVHIYASTEAGVGFSVKDQREGFPSQWLAPKGFLRDNGGVLEIRAQSFNAQYDDHSRLVGSDGFISTGDRIATSGDRVRFLGRDSGAINVGGNKVFPEEVEAVINTIPGIRMSHVYAKSSSILGSLVAADVVVSSGELGGDTKRRVTAACRDALESHKVPGFVRVVETLRPGASGKLERNLRK